MAHVRDAPVRPCLRLGCDVIHEGLENLVMACLEKDPMRRPRDVQAIFLELTRTTFASPWTRERAAAWWSGLAAVAPREQGELADRTTDL